MRCAECKGEFFAPSEGARQRCWMWTVAMPGVPDNPSVLPPDVFARLPCEPIGTVANVKKYATREDAMLALATVQADPMDDCRNMPGT